MPKIFISYRRDDTGGHAGRLRDRLIQRFGDANVFRDLDRIAAGANFVSSIQEAVGECDVLLALIGKQWLTIADERGRRLDDESDFVRLEITAALQRNVRVIPVLIQGAPMPRAHDLPTVLKALTERNALALTEAGWIDDVKRLEETIQPRRRWLRYVLSVLGVAVLILISRVTAFPPRPDDARITRDVRTALSNELGRFPIEANTDRGIVRLVGTVTTERDADHAEDIARNVSGVKKVINELKSTR
jgi:hypothetical protein